jgi:hypothetical protein
MICVGVEGHRRTNADDGGMKNKFSDDDLIPSLVNVIEISACCCPFGTLRNGHR